MWSCQHLAVAIIAGPSGGGKNDLQSESKSKVDDLYSRSSQLLNLQLPIALVLILVYFSLLCFLDTGFRNVGSGEGERLGP
ncbi:hypothetical protein B566_EDAN014832 [Ephemera danica]|nr:hypothetical protein B566_EDAN014832 [Ephemera danica]